MRCSAICDGGRQVNGHAGDMAGLAGKFDAAAVGCDDAVSDGQAKIRRSLHS